MSSRATDSGPRPPEADFGILLALAYRVYVDELHAALAARGYPDMRPSFGAVFRALHEQPLTLTQLAELLGTSKQAAAKLVAELVERGLVVQRASDEDRRRKDLTLSARGRALVRAAIDVAAKVEARLVAEVGPRAVAGMRAALEHLIVAGGGQTELRARRTRPV